MDKGNSFLERTEYKYFFSENMIDAARDGAHTVIARDVELDGDMDILGATRASMIW